MGNSECNAHPGLSMACDAAAEDFLVANPGRWRYGNSVSLASWVCRTGNYLSLTHGGLVGCRINFAWVGGGGPEEACVWTSIEAKRWYIKMRAACRDEGYECGAVQMMNLVQQYALGISCAMTIEYVRSCPDGLVEHVEPQ